MDEIPTKTTKLVFAGNSGVGKTSVINKYVRDSFEVDLDPTIGATYSSKTIELEKYKVMFQIWDTAGQETYQSLTKNFFKEANVVVLVYDTTNQITLSRLQSYIDMANDVCKPDVLYVLVGNKIDMSERRAVLTSQGSEFASKHNAPIFVETSAVTGENISMLFESIARSEYLTFLEARGLDVNEKEEKKEKCSC